MIEWLSHVSWTKTNGMPWVILGSQCDSIRIINPKQDVLLVCRAILEEQEVKTGDNIFEINNPECWISMSTEAGTETTLVALWPLTCLLCQPLKTLKYVGSLLKNPYSIHEEIKYTHKTG